MFLVKVMIYSIPTLLYVAGVAFAFGLPWPWRLLSIFWIAGAVWETTIVLQMRQHMKYKPKHAVDESTLMGDFTKKDGTHSKTYHPGGRILPLPDTVQVPLMWGEKIINRDGHVYVVEANGQLVYTGCKITMSP